MKRLIKEIVGRLGFQITRKPSAHSGPGFDDEELARQAIEVVRGNTMVSYEPLVTLFQQAKHCELARLEGAFVECGVWKGGAAGLMALASLKYGDGRRDLHLFDAFDDICEPDPAVDGDYAVEQVAELAGVDRNSLRGRLQPVKGVYRSHGGPGSVEIVRELIEGRIGFDSRRLHIHRGWFQDTLPHSADEVGKIAILRLDGDLYASTKVCLEYLYDRVVPGGFVVVDDYGAYEGCRKAVDEFRQARGIHDFISHVNRDCRYWIKSKP